MPKLYIIAGCNGAGKTTASYTIFPEILKCKEFVNADSIALGLSPFQPEKAAISAGKIMLNRIKELICLKSDFAIETTLSSVTFLDYIKLAKSKGYKIILIFIWINSTEIAIERVKERFIKGGHFIESDIVIRRYYRGISNLFKNYLPISDSWIIFDNSARNPKKIAEGDNQEILYIYDEIIYKIMKEQ